ncbi:hypothetical protein [Methylocystis parvus]|uniref:Uncharacterized protein n=1 Tax=Methylocystis parvus TaxID=134 RepID=A0A6B8MCS1_9HYPH|nr:hypothetical protein [Methylocystis parvus]QGN00176.1 hypothetical protein F7D14_21680 [Methylocystis parvus]WBK02515.1 hypothetical protein MMG94_20955 [Methylocystis parvus OBBP]
MDQATRVVLAEIFEARAAAKQRAELRQVQELDRQLEEHEEKKRREEEEDTLFHELMAASDAEVAIFRDRLE